MKILAIGAHYDDIEIGCAGTLYQHAKKGDEINYIIFNPDNVRSGSPRIRYKEQLDVFKLLNIPHENIRLVPSLDDDNKIEEMVSIIDSYESDRLFLPYWNDTHQHHRRVSKMGLSSLRRKQTTGYFYFSGSSIDFKGNVYNPIDYDYKLKVLNSFTSQIEKNSLKINLIMDYNKYCGSFLGNINVTAEPFLVTRMRYNHEQ